jgi:hypothetical protein
MGDRRKSNMDRLFDRLVLSMLTEKQPVNIDSMMRMTTATIFHDTTNKLRSSTIEPIGRSQIERQMTLEARALSYL